MSKRAAFFDVDKTLIPGSSLFLLARGMYERDFLRVRDILSFAWSQAVFRLLGHEPGRGMTQSREATLDFVRGRYREELEQWGREIADERILPRVYEDIARVIEGHKNAGDLTYLVTAAPVELATYMASALGMTGALGTVSELDDDGRYTGRLHGEVLHGAAKAKAVGRLSADEEIDLSQSAAYTDSINDLPLLESVGHAHAVNPDRELRRIARARGWPVHELRTRRRALLIGIPSALGGASVFALGGLTGYLIARKQMAESKRRRR